MDLDSAIRLLNLRLTPEEVEVCRCLEARGLRFCVDFGYSNAFEKHMEMLMEKE